MFWLGAVAKAIATGGTYPYVSGSQPDDSVTKLIKITRTQIVVKSRLQAATHQYGSSMQAILQILREEGLSGWWTIENEMIEVQLI